MVEEVFENYLVKKEIKHSKSKPYSPWSKGKIGRFWGIVYRELIANIFFNDLLHARKEIKKFIENYNFNRRHGGIGWLPLAKRYFNKKRKNIN